MDGLLAVIEFILGLGMFIMVCGGVIEIVELAMRSLNRGDRHGGFGGLGAKMFWAGGYILIGIVLLPMLVIVALDRQD